jgi:hypothetical protein
MDAMTHRLTLAFVSLLAGIAPAAKADTLVERFAAPKGTTRVAVTDGSFAAALRTLPLAPQGTPVLAFDGRVIDERPIAVVDLDVGARDLQQCADSIIRLDAEHRFKSGQHASIRYAFTSGDVYAFDSYVDGVRPVVDKRGRVTFAKKAAPVARDHDALLSYLDIIFLYAGTASLSATTARVDNAALAAGDFFVIGGFPGHAILILDVAKDASDRAQYLLGEGYMPAQSFHVVPTQEGGAWHTLDDDGALSVPTWSKPFPKGSARRMAPVPANSLLNNRSTG